MISHVGTARKSSALPVAMAGTKTCHARTVRPTGLEVKDFDINKIIMLRKQSQKISSCLTGSSDAKPTAPRTADYSREHRREPTMICVGTGSHQFDRHCGQEAPRLPIPGASRPDATPPAALHPETPGDSPPRQRPLAAAVLASATGPRSGPDRQGLSTPPLKYYIYLVYVTYHII